MSLELIRMLRNILLRGVVVAVVIFLVFGVLTMAYWSTWVSMVNAWFHLDERSFTVMVMQFFINLRYYLICFLLVPGLALHWTYQAELKRSNG